MKPITKRAMVLLMTACLLLSLSAPAVLAAEDTENAAPTAVYEFGRYANNGDYISNRAADLYRSYTAKTVNWRYEAAFNTYQFRIAEKHNDGKGTGQNKFVADSIQFLGAGGWWYALRLASPGAGLYDVTLTNGMTANNSRATIAIYFLDGDEIDKALGDNAANYAEIMSADPYTAGGTDAFNAYKEVIGGMLETATPAIETDFVDEKQVFRKEASGQTAFTSDNAMVMVVKFVSKDSLKLQLKSLSVTKTAELPEELRKQEDEGGLDITPFIVVGVVVVVGAAAAVVAVVNKKKKSTEA